MAFFRGKLGTVNGQLGGPTPRTEGSRGGLKEARGTKTRSDSLTIDAERCIRRTTGKTGGHLLRMREVASERGQTHVGDAANRFVVGPPRSFRDARWISIDTGSVFVALSLAART